MQDGIGRYVFYGFAIFVFVVALTLSLTWCGHRHDDDQNPLHEYYYGK
jgi:hypothetical protein